MGHARARPPPPPPPAALPPLRHWRFAIVMGPPCSSARNCAILASSAACAADSFAPSSSRFAACRCILRWLNAASLGGWVEGVGWRELGGGLGGEGWVGLREPGEGWTPGWSHPSAAPSTPHRPRPHRAFAAWKLSPPPITSPPPVTRISSGESSRARAASRRAMRFSTAASRPARGVGAGWECGCAGWRAQGGRGRMRALLAGPSAARPPAGIAWAPAGLLHPSPHPWPWAAARPAGPGRAGGWVRLG
jgi:hypothetical protein